MSDDKKNEQAKPIKDETLDKVSGGHIPGRPVSPIPQPKNPITGHDIQPD